MVPDDKELEAAIVEKLCRRDASGLAAVYDRYGSAAHSVVVRITRNSAAAEDLIQEVFLRVWNRSSYFDPKRGNLGVWILAIARNIAIDHLRSAQVRFDSRIRPIEQTDHPAISYKDYGAETTLDNARTVSEAFATLNEKQRRVLEMAYFEGFSQAEIAKRLSEPLGTVKSWMRSALAKLRMSIGSGGPSEVNHSEMDDLYELFVLSLLDTESSNAIQEHLNDNCEICTARIQDAEKLTAAFSALAGTVNPPRQLRARVLQIAQPQKASLSWMYAFAAAAVLALLLFGWGFQQQTALRSTSGEINGLLRERDALRSAVAILSRPDMKTVQFGLNQNVPHGRVFVSGSGGVVFVGSQLPELEASRTFEFWLIPAKGNPQPAGIFKANASGVSVNVLPQPVNTAGIAAVAVSVEPESGSPQPTTKPILIIPVV